ncbi:MAG TPA: DUF5615 family PIN-like protein [Candidatus Thermoplasmatota archaeon]|nr:DUF5615 family PIN-like protein [Candidatus Thermoplasmatota archaeon]
MGGVRGGLIPRFLANENIPLSVVEHLRRQGLRVMTVPEVGLQGATDEVVLREASDRQLTILTQDLDFGRIFVEREPRVQIVVLRAREPRSGVLIPMLEAFLKRADLASNDLRDALIVVGEHGFRVRRRV